MRQLVSQMEREKLVEVQGIDFPRTLVSLSDNDITAIWDITRMPGGLVNGRMHGRGTKSPYW